ncbi:MAG: potassium-transporting ATPase subunit KdpA, partial [Anaerolineaceae bacterium]|nr:potassium-transporting ATPase subunit KdpA [Anaerolineaceae bacterium]
PQSFKNISPDLAFNTAISFVSNTNWQNYAGESTLSYLSQMLGLTVQNFLSAATGITALLALIRGFSRHNTEKLGNFWSDLNRSILYVLLPLSLLVSILLVSQGVIQNFQPYREIQTLDQSTGQSTQILPQGPAASQIAIKMLGTNGGGYFNANSAHPYENPTPFSNFVEMLSILIIPASLTYTFGKMIGDTRQGWALFTVMIVLFVIMTGVAIHAEIQGNPNFAAMGVDQSAGNMEGKEVRFGAVNSAIWATATTAASNGSVNAMHDSFSPLGGLVAIWMMMLGEVVFGGVGSGLYGLLAFVIIAVFVAGLMVGRTPEYLGKKIEIFEMKMSAVIVLIPVIIALFGTAIALMTSAGRAGIFNAGPQGFSEALYAFTSAANNNGSAFAGLSGNTAFYNISLGIAMIMGRFILLVAALAIAGSLSIKTKLPSTSGTLPTHNLLFIGWLAGVIIIVGALSFLPALALGPIVQHLLMGTGTLF